MYKRDKKIILIDTTFLFDQYSNRGIGRYGKEVLKRLLKIITDDYSHWEAHLIGFLDLNKNLIEMGLTQFSIEEMQSKIVFHSIGEPNLSSPKNKKLWKSSYWTIIDDLDPDIYYAIHFERGLPTTKGLGKKLSSKIKTAVTVHDVIPMVNNRYSQKSPIHNFFKKRFYNFMWSGVTAADVIFAPSNFSKNDLIKYGHVDESKIRTIYLGVNEIFFKDEVDMPSPEVEEEILQTYEILNRDKKKKKYFFYDSGLEANKGIDNLLEIFKYFKDDTTGKFPNYLVIVGGDMQKGIGENIKPRTKNGKWLIDYAKKIGVLDSIVATDRIPDLDLQILLFNAFAYIYLSNYEGFGFGPLQAMAARIPAIASASSCIPEITKSGALLIDSFDHDRSVSDIKEFLSDEEKLKDWIKRATDIAKSYNWDTTVEKTWEELQKLISN